MGFLAVARSDFSVADPMPTPLIKDVKDLERITSSVVDQQVALFTRFELRTKACLKALSDERNRRGRVIKQKSRRVDRHSTAIWAGSERCNTMRLLVLLTSGEIDTENDADDGQNNNLASAQAAVRHPLMIQKQIHFFLRAFRTSSTARFVWFKL